MALPPLLGMRRKPPAHAECPLRSRLFIPGLGCGDPNYAQLVPGRRHVITIKRMARSMQLDCQHDASLRNDTMKFREDTLLKYQRILLSPFADIMATQQQGQSYTSKTHGGQVYILALPITISSVLGLQRRVDDSGTARE
jgi:hypothetical protein